MTVEMIRAFFGWCTLLNWGIMIIYFMFITLGRSWTYRMHGKMFDIPPENFGKIHYQILGGYKVAVFVFNLVPYLVLRIIA